MGESNIVVVGGSGFYGRYVVADLLRRPDVRVTVVSRTPPRPPFPSQRVHWVAGDRDAPGRLAGLLGDAAAVVHCAGPFQALDGPGTHPLGPLRAAVAAGVPYVDISEDRGFLRAAATAAGPATAPVLTGASVVPGLQTLIVDDLARGMDRVDGVLCCAAPDTRRHRGPAMFEAMMHGAGLPFTAPRGGVPTVVHGWSEPEWTLFPPPVGRRLVHQVYEMADLDVLAGLYGARTIAFKAGTEFTAVNRALGLFAAVRARTGRPRAARRWTPLVRALSWLVGRVGDEAGGFTVSVSGWRDGRAVTRRMGMTARQDGGRIPSLLAGIAVEHLLTGRLHTAGLVPLRSWLTPHELRTALRDRDIGLWRRDDEADDWRSWED
ncbi:saccharopine dehydrogenase NADP-binding domain-containing protein [Streptomyces sp. NPDC015139]|uniref:saccharopine dehydrogenase NADP-binding domain-containing protein n=1 Tax=Streptomyces sp. NPDC015139 TaxID=3364942 RepID=UPI0036FE4486